MFITTTSHQGDDDTWQKSAGVEAHLFYGHRPLLCFTKRSKTLKMPAFLITQLQRHSETLTENPQTLYKRSKEVLLEFSDFILFFSCLEFRVWVPYPILSSVLSYSKQRFHKLQLSKIQDLPFVQIYFHHSNYNVKTQKAYDI